MSMSRKTQVLVIGDVVAIGILTLIGFATHNETGFSYLPRMLALFLPMIIGWFLLSPFLGVFDQEQAASFHQIWKPAFTMFFVVPFGVVLRGLILGAPIIPLFALVLSAVSAFGMLIWRGIYFLLNRK